MFYHLQAKSDRIWEIPIFLGSKTENLIRYTSPYNSMVDQLRSEATFKSVATRLFLSIDHSLPIGTSLFSSFQLPAFFESSVILKTLGSYCFQATIRHGSLTRLLVQLTLQNCMGQKFQKKAQNGLEKSERPRQPSPLDAVKGLWCCVCLYTSSSGVGQSLSALTMVRHRPGPNSTPPQLV